MCIMALEAMAVIELTTVLITCTLREIILVRMIDKHEHWQSAVLKSDLNYWHMTQIMHSDEKVLGPSPINHRLV